MNTFQECDYRYSIRCENTKAQVTMVINQFVVYSYWSQDNNHSRNILQEGRMAQWLERWTCNLEALSSSPTLTASWMCSR